MFVRIFPYLQPNSRKGKWDGSELLVTKVKIYIRTNSIIFMPKDGKINGGAVTFHW
jgi:hypothetical protein